MLRALSARASSALSAAAFRALCTGFPSLRRRGRVPFGGVVWVGFGPVVLAGVPLSCWAGPLGLRLAALAFRLL